MKGSTHATLGAAAGLLMAGFTHGDPLYCLAAGVIGGLLPDIDHPQSMLSGWIPGSALVMSLGRVRHRGFTHSIVFMVLLVAGWFAISQQIAFPYMVAAAALAGVATHILSDMLTPQGVRLLWPLRANWKAAPGFVLQVGKFFGVVELLVWLGALVGIAGALFFIAQEHL